jgi:endonuclease YncB( thermonuclease family)
MFFGILFLVSTLGILLIAFTPYLYRNAQSRHEKLLLYRPVWILVFVVLMVWGVAGWQSAITSDTHYSGSYGNSSYIKNQYPIYDSSYKVLKVASGNKAQVKLSRGPAPVSLIGVDLLSSTDKAQDSCYKKQAVRKLGQFLNNKNVELEGDDSIDDTSKSDTLLRYLISGDENIGAQMIASGYAKASGNADYKYHDQFISAEKDAKAKKLGLWSGSVCRKISLNDSPANYEPASAKHSIIYKPAAKNPSKMNKKSGSSGTRNPGGSKDTKGDNDENNNGGSGCVIKLPILGCL